MDFESATYQVKDLIGDGFLFIGDGYRAKNAELSSAGLPFARAGDINDGFHFGSGDCLPVEDAHKAGNKISEVGDVVFTSKGTVGRFGYVSSEIQKFVYSPQLCFWRSLRHDLIDPSFLYYWVQGREFYRQYKSVSQKTDMAEYVSLSDQRAMEITLPCVENQREVAHILGTLDEKIELNRQANGTLEDIAKALFKSWFVDFDPVRAKAEGRPTGLPDEIGGLFPDSFEESELGEIPSGWSCPSVYDLADYVNGASHPSKSLNDNRLGYPVIKINELKNGFTDQTKYWDADYKEKHLVAKGDILFSWSGNPDTSIGTFVWSKQDGLLNQHIFKVVPRESEWRSFVLSMLRSNQKTFADIARDKQTTGLGHVTVKDLKEMMCPIASDAVMTTFASLVDDILERCQNLVLQIDVLEDLRDALLPRLISGELRVPDAEKMLEEVGI